MAKRPDAKSQFLREQGTLNPRPQLVSDEMFRDSEFFDPRDLVLVKYEMLRRVRREEMDVSEAAAAFGFSRPSFYQAQSLFQHGGLAGLIPNGLVRGMRTSCRTKSSIISGSNNSSTNCCERRS